MLIVSGHFFMLLSHCVKKRHLNRTRLSNPWPFAAICAKGIVLYSYTQLANSREEKVHLPM